MNLAPLCSPTPPPRRTLTLRLALLPGVRPGPAPRPPATLTPELPADELLRQLLAAGTLHGLEERGTLFASLPPEDRCFAGFYRGCPVAFLNRGEAGDGLTPSELALAANCLRAAGWMVWEVVEAEHVQMALAAVDHALTGEERGRL